MTRKNNKLVRRQYKTVHTLCCIVFCMFTFLYLYFYQGDVLAMAQHVLSEGATAYDSLIGACVITLVLLLVHLFVYSVASLYRWLYWLTYLPSFLILAVITDVDPGSGTQVYNYAWAWIAPLVLIVYSLMVNALGELDSLSKDLHAGSVLSKSMWINLLGITLMMITVTGIAGTDVTLHHRMKMEKCISEGDFQGALEVGSGYAGTDASLTMLRAYALAAEGQLGERLFEYPLAGGSAALYPDGSGTATAMIYGGDIMRFIRSKRMGRRSVEADYHLCGLLMDCRIRQFAREVQKYYSADSLMPRHYREAMFLYNDIAGKGNAVAADDEMSKRYSRFSALSKKYPDRSKLKAALSPDYKGTYWYYYVCRTSR